MQFDGNEFIFKISVKWSIFYRTVISEYLNNVIVILSLRCNNCDLVTLNAIVILSLICNCGPVTKT